MIDEDFWEYQIPEIYKKRFDKKFLLLFGNNLLKVFEKYHRELNDILFYEVGTNGWYTAFVKTCWKTDDEDVIKYYDNLEWYDSDKFDSEIVELFYDKNITKRRKENE